MRSKRKIQERLRVWERAAMEAADEAVKRGEFIVDSEDYQLFRALADELRWVLGEEDERQT
jgi:hypothetical protein